MEIITFYTRSEDSSICERPKMSRQLYLHLEKIGYEFDQGFFDPKDTVLMLSDIQEFRDNSEELVSFLNENLNKRVYFDRSYPTT